MDKYQSKLLGRNKQLSLDSGNGNGKVELTDTELVLTQNENYNIKKYVLHITNDTIESVQIDDKLIKGNEAFEINIDFGNKAKEITFIFRNGFANPCMLKFKYVEADKALYDQKVIAQNNATCIANMNATYRTGLDLVNIYWNKATEQYAYTKVALFALVENNKNRKDIFMQEYIIDNNVFYKSITGLAFGEYKATVSQYDSKNGIIVSIDIPFTISHILDKELKTIIDKLGVHEAYLKAMRPHTVCI